MSRNTFGGALRDIPKDCNFVCRITVSTLETPSSFSLHGENLTPIWQTVWDQILVFDFLADAAT